MRKKCLALVLAGTMGMLGSATVYAQRNAAPGDNMVLQRELAVMLVRLLGLRSSLPPNPSDLQCIAALLENGISPADGWQPDKPVVVADLARVVVQSMGIQDQVEKPDDPASWVALLESLGISFETVRQATSRVRPLEQPVLSAIFGLADSQDPLVRRRAGEPDEIDYGVDVEIIFSEIVGHADVARILREVERPRPRRRPVTPD